MTMVRYDAEADAMYVKIADARGEIETEEMDEFRLVDYDERNAVVGVEFLFVSRGIDLEGVPHGDVIAAALKKLAAAAPAA